MLNEAGYTGQLTATNSQQSDVAARLLMKLFREGVTDRGALAGKRRKHFGYVPVDTLLYKPVNKNRRAIQGTVPAATRSFS